ncbi:MAG: single-stranded DNA-binding protein [Deltaproteobacteria bacterium]|nr:single-stranded DNA-binding protein [Deltaproteobacteria bacterium]
MASVNKIILVGNAGRDPEVRFLPSGSSVANFSVATSENWNNRDGEREEHTEWHRVAAFGRLADYCAKSVFKGKQVNVEGRLRTRQWEDKEGNKRFTTEVIATNVLVLGEGDEVSKAILIGKVDQAPELRTLPSGREVVNFNIVTTTQRQNREGEPEERSETHRLVAFGKLAEICSRYLTPGKRIYAEGRIQTREWTNQEGTTQSTTECVMNNMQMLGSKTEEGRQDSNGSSQVSDAASGSQGGQDDDIPF